METKLMRWARKQAALALFGPGSGQSRKKRGHRTARFSAFLSVILILLQLFCTLPALCQIEFCDVYVGQEKVFSVTNTHLSSALERGERINEVLRNIVADDSVNPDSLFIRTGMDGVPVICLGNNVILAVTTLDAGEAGKSVQALAQEWLTTLKKRIVEERAAEAAQKKNAGGQPGQAEKRGRAEKGNSTLSEHAVLLLFIEISLLLLTSLVLGEVMVRLGQPAIIGQILAGLILGPTFFGAFFPDLSAQLFPRDGSQSRLIEVISWIGVSLILMLTGMETDTAMLKRLGKPLMSFGFLGLLGPLFAGGIISLLLPERLMGDDPNRLAFAVFIGTVFAASSVPVVAKILMDMKMLKLDIGQLIIATSLAHDLLCCLLLAIIVVLSGTGDGSSGPVIIALVGTVCFLALVYFGRPLFFTGLRWVNDHVSSGDGLITAMVVLLLASAAATEALGVHIVLGAFAAGVILSQAPVINHKVVRPLEIVTMGFFAPIFFASSGLNVNLSTLLEPSLGVITVALAVAALVLKLSACMGAGKLSGLGTWESLSIGVGANAKGSLGLILAMLGYSLDIISQDMFAVVIFISLFSTGIAAPLMKITMSKVQVTDEERERIKREERKSRTILSTIRRILCPTSGKGRNLFLTKLMNSLGQTQIIETTSLWVKKSDSPSEKPFATVNDLIDRKSVGVLEKTIHSDDPIEAISEEANRGYDLLVFAADEPPGDSHFVFSPLVDGVIMNTSTRTLVVYDPEPATQRDIRRVLVPVSGSELSISAAEFGIELAKSLNATVTCLFVTESEAVELYGDTTQSGKKIQSNVSNEIESTLKELSEALDVEFASMLVQTSSHPAQAAILTAQQNDIDLIVLGAEPKLGKTLFFGHTINYILRHAPCAVAVLKMRG
jgi:Kef-type K+ transport system membrane component KefB/nucleotide-binding universal stress UspA family protein